MERSVKLHRDEQGQFVEIPSEFEFPGEEAIMRKEGDKLTIEPVPKLLETLEPLDEDFPEIERLPTRSVDL